ncbi:hypothetical protein [Microvirga sp. VF16]|uniref:hypothetical protein n=1 Tax=Microvirga sp. VF16 TaxID=2807101 RepID=UPI00193DDC79|nr:hypothetical protein [Microvirga sp. VF16]QRM28278.1 hypothetical protein JO965_18830 [Microvirga sp. VF16]
MTSDAKIKISAIHLTAIILTILATVHVVFFVQGEHHVYVNDFRNFWIAYWESSLRFKESVYYWAVHLRNEIWASDYNSMPAVLLLPFSLTFGYARVGYILGVALTYFVPVALLSATAAYLTVQPKSKQTFAFVAFSMFAGLYVPYWTPTLLGFPDIVGLIPLALAYIVIRTTGLGYRVRPGVALLLGALIWMPFLFRRWYAFTIVALALSAPLYCLVGAVIEKGISWRDALRSTTVNFAIGGATSAALALMLQGGLIQTVLNTSYSSIYVAYQRPAWGHITNLWQTFGTIYLALAVAAQAFLFGSLRKRLDVLFININIAVIFALFTQTQGFGPQHYLPLAFWFFLLSCLGLSLLWSSMAKPVPAVAAGQALVALGVFAASFYHSIPRPQWASVLLPRPTYKNLIGNQREYVRLTKRLNKLLEPGEKFTVFASSMSLNRDTLLSASREALAGKDLDASHVDLIQGLTVSPFMAQYAVLSNPILTHLPENTQSVITIPAKAILSGQGIGAAYKRIDGSFRIANGLEAFIYEKQRPFTSAEVNALLEEFYAIYPSWRDVYGNAAFRLAMTSAIELGNKYGRFEYAASGELIVHPGETAPTRFTFLSSGAPLRLTVGAPCADADGVDVQLLRAQETITHIEIAPEGTATLSLPDAGAMLTIVISKRGNPWCDVVRIAELPSQR